MHLKDSLEQKITPSEQGKGELNWWMHNLNLYNGKCLITPPAQLIISSDARSQGWGASCQGKRMGGTGQGKRGNPT